MVKIYLLRGFSDREQEKHRQIPFLNLWFDPIKNQTQFICFTGNHSNHHYKDRETGTRFSNRCLHLHLHTTVHLFNSY